ncbi:MAG: hypothetical protein HY770_00630, partial [Chitinivibrionia bacterium]|nr:hypothetical protein [Chitinivibrionia bacterium]
VIGVLNSLLSLYYYLRVIVVMYMQKNDEPVSAYDDLGVKVAIAASLLAVLWLGIGPAGWIPGVETILEWTRDSVAPLVSP